MILSKEYYNFFTKKQLNNCVRIKDIFYLSKEISDEPENEKILSLTKRGIIERDISKNEGQLPESFKEYNKIKKGDIVLNPMDLISGWVDISGISGLISPSYKVLRSKFEINPDYFCYQLQRYYKEKILFHFGEGVSYQYRWGLNNSILMNFPIMNTSLTEQNKIVDRIKNEQIKIKNDIDIYESKIKILEELMESISYEQFLNPSQDE